MNAANIQVQARVHQGALFGDVVAGSQDSKRPVAAPPAKADNGIDIDTAVGFLKWLDPDGWHHLDHAPPDRVSDGPYFRGRTFAPNAWGEVRDYIRSIPVGHNVFYSLNEPAAGTHGTKLSKDKIAKIRVIATDIDPDKSKPLPEAEADVEARAVRLLSSALPPSLLVHSGGGRHALWKLNEKLDARTAQDVAEATGRALARSVGGDSTHDISRIFGLPGSINHPAKKKREHGRTDAPVRVLQRPDRRVSVDELASAYPAAADDQHDVRDDDAARAAENEAVQLYRSTTLRRDGCGPEDLPEFEDLDARFAAACGSNERLARLWRHDPAVAPKDRSGSGWVGALARQMAEAADFTAVDFARKLVEWAHPAVDPDKYDPDDDENGGARQVARAWARIGRSGTEARERRSVPETWYDTAASAGAGDQAPRASGHRPVDFAALTATGVTDLENIPPKEFVLGTRFQPASYTVGLGPGGVSKSMYAMLSAASIALNRPLTGELVSKSGPVLVYDAETPLDEMRRRLLALAARHGLPLAEVADQVRLLSGHDHRLTIAQRHERTNEVVAGPHLHELIGFIRHVGIIHVVLDPLVTLHRGLDENSSGDMERVTDFVRQIASQTGVSVDLVHHTVKNRSGQPESNAGSADAGRGSGAITQQSRSSYTLSPMAAKTGLDLGLDAERTAQMIRVDDAKRNNTRRSARPRWYEILSVLPDGTTVPGWHFEASDPALRAKALETVGVHVLFDAQGQRSLVNIGNADAECRKAGLLSFLVGRMARDAVSRTQLIAALMEARGVGETSARTMIDEAVPANKRSAVDAEGDGIRFRIWREQRRTGRQTAWHVCREAVGQNVSRMEGVAGAEDDPDVSDDGVFA